MTDNNAAENTDIEIWRKVVNDFCSPSIHVTKSGSIGMNVGSSVIVAPVEKWFKALQEEGKERHEFDFCMEPALWKNTKKPTGKYCDKHKEILEKFFPDNWSLLDDQERSLCLCAESNSRMRKEKQMENTT